MSASQPAAGSWSAMGDNNYDDDYYDDYPYIVLQMVVTAGVLPEGEQSLTMPAVGGTLLGQEKGGVPQLVWDCILKIDSTILKNLF